MAGKKRWYTQTARILEELDKHARHKGAEAIRASVNEGRAHKIEVRDGDFGEGKAEHDSRLSLAVYMAGGRHSSFSLNYQADRFDIDSAKSFIERAIDSATLHPEDPYAGLADPAEILQDKIHDESAFDNRYLLRPEDMIKQATEAERAALGRTDKGIESSQGASMDTRISRSMLYLSNGFIGVTSNKNYGIKLVVKGAYQDADGNTHYTLGGDVANEKEYTDLDAPQTLADRVVHEADRMRYARPLTSDDKNSNVSLVFEPDIAPAFWSGVLGALDGNAVAKGMSFLQKHFEAAILPRDLSVVNDPTLKNTPGHCYFDGDGLPVQRQVMIENGVIRNWFLDLYNARKLGMVPTGEPANLLIESDNPAANDLDDLISDIGTGILVTDFNGGGMDTVMGQYKVGAAGILIRDGKMVEPVRDFSLAHDNLTGMLATTQVAQDRERQGRLWTPSVRVDGLKLSA